VNQPGFQMPYAVQGAIGFQKQLAPGWGLDSDLTHIKEHNVIRTRDINLFFNPQTGYNLDPILTGRPDPSWDAITEQESNGTTEALTLPTGLTKLGATYALMFYAKDNVTPAANNQIDLDAEWGRSSFFQGNTIRVNGIVTLPFGISASGLYQYGSGNYFSTTVSGRPFNKPGTNRLNIGAPIAIPRTMLGRFDGPDVIGTGVVVPKNALHGLPIHKVDAHLTKTFTVGRLRATGIAEVSNLFNHANYGSYNGVVNSATFGPPQQNTAVNYGPRIGQFAFRLQF